ncbi:hypothetical protein MMC19_000342, partial [Ptychographa xylographoides]|nr:hypothetical protein [Ptychographa xylographoides]
MPPLLSESEAESGSEEVIPPKKTGTKHTSDKKASAEPVEKDIEPEDVEDDEEDDDDDDEEEEEEV